MKLAKFLLPACLVAQTFFATAQDKAPENWFNLSLDVENVHGINTEKAYKELLAGKTPKKQVLVAVIDSGVDEEHEDLKDVMWKNPGEIPGDGIDNDKNGYIDDVYGWNFLGGKDGKNVNNETLEVTRMYARLAAKKKLKKGEKALFDKIKKEYDKKVGEIANGRQTIQLFRNSIKLLQAELKKDEFTADEVKAIETEDQGLALAQNMIGGSLAGGSTVKELLEGMTGWEKYLDDQENYFYNKDFNPRAEIIGDNYDKVKDRYYGNNDVTGPDAGHGTHVAGIIAAVRDNELGMKGVANNVRIMSVRAVPNGDEHDKDVANAIRYAVDNGADIINMSFGKSYSYMPKEVNKAIKYAQKKNVLLVHAAGNSGLNTDVESNFPNKYYNDKKTKQASNWLEVGALSWKKDLDKPATFSNYGRKNVDVFAPGVDIYSTVPHKNEYASYSGTSMAAPVTAGAAALVLSYYPELSAAELKKVIKKSVDVLDMDVKCPNLDKSTDKGVVKFQKLCNTSGVVNVYKALQLAEEMTKSKK